MPTVYRSRRIRASTREHLGEHLADAIIGAAVGTVITAAIHLTWPGLAIELASHL